MKKNLLKSNKGITLMSLIVTIIIMVILAGVSIRAITGSEGLINQAKETKNAAQMKDLEEQIELAIVKAESKGNDVTMDDVIEQLIQAGIISSETQVDKTTGTITIDDYVWEGRLANYIVTDEEKYYGNANTVATDMNYFTFKINEDGKTATITGIKDDYAEKYYYEDRGYIAAIKYNDIYITDVVIPYEITDTSGNEYTVNAIEKEAFRTNYYDGNTESLEVEANAYFTSFVLPKSIKTIGEYAFYGCPNLSSVNIPSSVTSIGDYAFLNCISLSSINIPSSVTSIGYGAFQNCLRLSSINIPSSVTSIGNYAFYYCTKLSSINIPSSVTSIGNAAFSRCTSLSSIKISEGVTSIGTQAFQECTSLSSIKIPDSVTSIGLQAFQGCTSLMSINIPDSVTSMEGSAFYGWTASQKINCEAASVPSGWNSGWNTGCNATISWGVSM